MAKKKQLTEDVIETPRFTYRSIIELNAKVNMLKNMDISVPSITSLIKFKAEVKQILKEFNEAIKTLCEDKYGLKTEGNGGYTYLGHAQEKEIRADVEQLELTPIELKAKLNFMTEKELAAATSGLQMNMVADLFEALLKN